MTREECRKDNALYDQVMDTVNFALELDGTMDFVKIRDIMTMKESYDFNRIILIGCGDCYMASLAMKPAFEKLTGIRTDAMRLIDYNRYLDSAELGDTPNNPLVILISIAGSFARVIEAAERGKKHGAMTIGITNCPESEMALSCTKVFDLTLPTLAYTVGASTYLALNAALLQLAIRIGFVRRKFPEADLMHYRKALTDYYESYREALPKIDDQMWEVANRWKNLDKFDFIGDYADHGTAMFGAAKITELFGGLCSWDDTEGWSHVNVFAKDPKHIATGLVSNPDTPSFSRGLEIARGFSLLGRPALVLTTADASAFPEGLDVCTMPAAEYGYMNPVMQHVAFSLLGAYLYKLKGIQPFRKNDPDFGVGYSAREDSEVEVI